MQYVRRPIVFWIFIGLDIAIVPKPETSQVSLTIPMQFRIVREQLMWLSVDADVERTVVALV